MNVVPTVLYSYYCCVLTTHYTIILRLPTLSPWLLFHVLQSWYLS